MKTYYLIVHLPNGKRLLIDSPATTDDQAQRDAALAYYRHVNSIRVEIKTL